MIPPSAGKYHKEWMDLHKVLDNSVERGALIAVTKVLAIRVLTSSKRTEVLDSLGHGPARGEILLLECDLRGAIKGWRTYLP